MFDLSFEKDMKVLPHYHFAAIPVGSNRIRSYMKCMQEVRKTMMKNMKIKTSFHFQSFGLKNKEGVLSYLAKRSAGLYSWKESKNAEYIPSKKGKLLRDIQNKKYFTLHDVLTPEQYIKHFYNRRHFDTMGGLPRPRHGSILTDNLPSFCPIHGALESKDVRVEILFEQISHIPPNFIKSYPPFEIIHQKI